MSYQLELRHFQYFIAVAEELHFKRAAEKLYIAQPGLSRQIKQMEEIIGARLFDRDKRNVSLTPAGEYLKNEVGYLLNHIEFVKKQTGFMASGILGEVRIGFLGSAMQHIIPDLLLKLNGRYPEINSTLEEMSNYDQIEAILTDKLDLGFVRLGRVPEGLRLKPIFYDTFSIVLPESHSLRKDTFKSISQLRDDNFILFSADYSSLYFNKVMSICEDAGFTPQVSHRSVHALTIFKLVENGLGVAIVPTTLMHGFDLKVKFIELIDIPQQAILSAVWKQNNRNPVLSKVLQLME